MKVFIHCGPPRTGTTSFQNLLQAISGKYPSVYIPQSGWDPDSFGYAHHNLLEYDNKFRSISLGEFGISNETFDDFVGVLNRHKESDVGIVVSTERFASFIWNQVSELYSRLSNFECYFVFGSRDLFDVHVSIWRKRVELGWRVSLEDSIKTIFSELMYMYIFFPKLIASKFGRNAVRMVPYTSNHTDNLIGLAKACGMGGLTEEPDFISIVNSQPILSESMPFAEVELTRLANEAVCSELNPLGEWVRGEWISLRDEILVKLKSGQGENIDYLSDKRISDLRELYQGCGFKFSDLK